MTPPRSHQSIGHRSRHARRPAGASIIARDSRAARGRLRRASCRRRRWPIEQRLQHIFSELGTSSRASARRRRRRGAVRRHECPLGHGRRRGAHRGDAGGDARRLPCTTTPPPASSRSSPGTGGARRPRCARCCASSSGWPGAAGDLNASDALAVALCHAVQMQRRRLLWARRRWHLALSRRSHRQSRSVLIDPNNLSDTGNVIAESGVLLVTGRRKATTKHEIHGRQPQHILHTLRLARAARRFRRPRAVAVRAWGRSGGSVRPAAAAAPAPRFRLRSRLTAPSASSGPATSSRGSWCRWRCAATTGIVLVDDDGGMRAETALSDTAAAAGARHLHASPGSTATATASSTPASTPAHGDLPAGLQHPPRQPAVAVPPRRAGRHAPHRGRAPLALPARISDGGASRAPFWLAWPGSSRPMWRRYISSAAMLFASQISPASTSASASSSVTRSSAQVLVLVGVERVFDEIRGDVDVLVLLGVAGRQEHAADARRACRDAPSPPAARAAPPPRATRRDHRCRRRATRAATRAPGAGTGAPSAARPSVATGTSTTAPAVLDDLARVGARRRAHAERIDAQADHLPVEDALRSRRRPGSSTSSVDLCRIASHSAARTIAISLQPGNFGQR